MNLRRMNEGLNYFKYFKHKSLKIPITFFLKILIIIKIEKDNFLKYFSNHPYVSHLYL